MQEDGEQIGRFAFLFLIILGYLIQCHSFASSGR